jgi:hypothetical protein
MQNQKWYTYHIIDPENSKVFYVGKGQGNRAYIHMTRALHWKETGKLVPGANLHLYNKLLKIHNKNLQAEYLLTFFSTEQEALEQEKCDISLFGLENLCNLTHGGEGETKTPETLLKMSQSMKEFWNSEDGYAMKKKFSEDRLGDKNPMWGVKLDEETIKQKVDAMLSVPRWNKGLKNDPRSKGPPKGTIPHNALPCRLINEDGKIFEARSIKELSEVSKVPITTISKLHLGYVKKNKKGWKFELISKNEEKNS